MKAVVVVFVVRRILRISVNTPVLIRRLNAPLGVSIIVLIGRLVQPLRGSINVALRVKPLVGKGIFSPTD